MRPPTLDTELSNLIPPSSEEEKSQLQNNLLAAGRPLDTLKVWKGKGILLDGHTRLEICEKFNLPYEVEEISVNSREEAKAWILRNQLGRRNISASQRAILAAQLVNTTHGGDRKSDQSAKLHVDSVTAKQASLVAGVSERLVKDARKVIEHGSEGLQEAVLSGEVAVPDAAKIVDLPKPKQDEAVTRKRQGAAKTVAAEKTPFQKLADEKIGIPELDEVGLPIRPEMVLVWKTRGDMLELMKQLKRIGLAINELAKRPGAECYRSQLRHKVRTVEGKEVQTNECPKQKDAYYSLKFYLPYANYCPYCWNTHKKPTHKDCKACKGLGYVVKSTWDNAPEITRRVMLKEVQ